MKRLVDSSASRALPEHVERSGFNKLAATGKPGYAALSASLAAALITSCGPSLPRAPWPTSRRAVRPRTIRGLTTLRLKAPQGGDLVLIQRVARASRANLDCAAYLNNPLRRPPELDAQGAARVAPGYRPFGEALVQQSLTSAIEGTPLSKAESERPLALAPLVDYLARWRPAEAEALTAVQSAVRAESWGHRLRPGTFYQEITALYLHRGKAGIELWAEVAFHPSAGLFTTMRGSEYDGRTKVFGRLRRNALSKTALDEIERDYIARTLSPREVQAWGHELASYWYPTYNTDLRQLRVFPDASTEAGPRQAAGSLRIEQPTLVLRGKPDGRAVYNVFVVAGAQPPGVPTGAAPHRAAPHSAAPHSAARGSRRPPVQPAPEPVRQTLEAEAQRHGGYSKWIAANAPFRRALQRWLSARAKSIHALIGREGFLFYRRSLSYLLGGEPTAQAPGKNPLPVFVEFARYLAREGVDLLVVLVPPKAEVYPDKLPLSRALRASLKPQSLPLVHPEGRKFLRDLSAAGVEVLDLLPSLLSRRLQKGAPLLYQPQDTHWTSAGLQLAADQLAARVRRYRWFGALGSQRQRFTTRSVALRRYGDLHSRLLDGEQRRYRPQALRANQVLFDGKPCDDDQQSPIVVLGDSFTGVFQRTEPQSAGLSAHLARALGHRVDLVMSYGSGPNVRQKLLRRGPVDLRRRKLVIWVQAARELYHHWEPWQPLDQLSPPKTTGSTHGVR